MTNDKPTIENVLDALTSQRDEVLDLLGYGPRDETDAELERLRSINADLLAAAKAVLADDSDLQVWADLKDAIAKAESMP